ncbi:MAG: hypothetical protein OQL20_02005, partial [Sedimenticola sp.]|nr:hypothetical protein [Sedimenticola sp.]
PITFQEPGQKIASAFILKGSDYGFAVHSYDKSADLIIDPWVTYYGGSSNEVRPSLALDGFGNIVVGGGTKSLDFPAYQAIQSSYAGGC